LIETCKLLGVPNVKSKSDIGVWVNDMRKIGFVGIHNSRWITSHGISLNVCNELEWFRHIVPCGLEGLEVTSIAKELGKDGCDLIDDAQDAMKKAITRIFNVQLEEIDYPSALHKTT